MGPSEKVSKNGDFDVTGRRVKCVPGYGFRINHPLDPAADAPLHRETPCNNNDSRYSVILRFTFLRRFISSSAIDAAWIYV